MACSPPPPEGSHLPGPPSSWGTRNFCLQPTPFAFPTRSRPAATHLPRGPEPAGAASLWSTTSWSRLQGHPLCDRLPPSGTLGHRVYGGHSLFPLAAGGVLYGFLYRSRPTPPTSPNHEARGVPPRVWSRVAGPSWWAGREVDGRARGWGRAALPWIAEG